MKILKGHERDQVEIYNIEGVLSYLWSLPDQVMQDERDIIIWSLLVNTCSGPEDIEALLRSYLGEKSLKEI